jgi:crotonobetainyl-CoA:carnitine CoA-transferase CaiB-like acyl-CoA transferase
MSGFMSTTGKENSLPIRVSFALFDVYTGMMVFIYVLAALYANAKPIKIEVLLHDVAIFSMYSIPMFYLLTGKKVKRMRHTRHLLPTRLFRIKKRGGLLL